MNPASNNEFAKRMMLMARPSEHFEPTATYDPDGDCIEFLAKPDPFYAERIDDLVTVYYSQETHEIMGSLIKGIRAFCANVLRAMPGFKIEVSDGRVNLDHIFLAKLWTTPLPPDDMAILKYRKLIQVAEDVNAQAENMHCMS